MKVKLLAHTPEPEKLIAAAAKNCYSSSNIDNVLEGLTEEKTENFVNMLSEIGHESPIEHVSFTFAIEGVSRSLLAQITRHRMASFSVQSQRYVREKGFEYVLPPEIDKIPAAREKFIQAMEDDFRTIQRYRMKRKLKQMYPEVAYDYERDIEGHEIYVHDEASTPTLKQYCMAVSLYPLMLEGCGVLDKTTPSEPNDLQSFSGQLVNSIFTLSAQCKGAVAVGSYFIALNYYIIAEYGEKWYEHLDDVVTSSNCKKSRTMRNMIEKAFKQFVCGINQPAGNRGYQSPFTNISYYDHTYFSSLFGTFYYPDGTQPEWEAVDALQRLFMNWFNQWRLRQLVAFPVETMAMVYDPKTEDIIDKDYKDLTAEMYAKGHSFFTYISDSADSLASCCRLRNELSENTFSPTSGMTGIKTGSANVITLNVNRIIQNYFGPCKHEEVVKKELWNDSVHRSEFVRYLTSILERVYKYHIAYKTMLYEWESKGAYASSNGGFINIKDLYSTIGINGLNEAARFLGLEVSNNPEYIQFLQLVLGTIKEQNKKHSIHDKKRPFLFNSECVPAESLGGKNYRWDKNDGLLDNAHLKPFLIDSEALKTRVTRRKQGLYSCAA